MNRIKMRMIKVIQQIATITMKISINTPFEKKNSHSSMTPSYLRVLQGPWTFGKLNQPSGWFMCPQFDGPIGKYHLV